MAVAGSEDAVRSAVIDYVEGWFEGDAGRMKRALPFKAGRDRPRPAG